MQSSCLVVQTYTVGLLLKCSFKTHCIMYIDSPWLPPPLQNTWFAQCHWCRIRYKWGKRSGLSVFRLLLLLLFVIHCFMTVTIVCRGYRRSIKPRLHQGNMLPVSRQHNYYSFVSRSTCDPLYPATDGQNLLSIYKQHVAGNRTRCQQHVALV